MKYPGLQNQPHLDESPGVVADRIRRFLRAQFGQPSGVWGHLAGRIMARTPSNLERIRWTLALLDPRPADRILEIGFGPGIAIERLSKVVPDGLIVGIDHSEVMVRQASRRNAVAIGEGRVALQLGSATMLPTFDEPFDRIFTINSIHFWPRPVECLKTLHSMLKPGGLIAVTIQPRSRTATDETTKVIGDEIAADLAQAGFSRCRVELRKMAPVAVACALGVK